MSEPLSSSRKVAIPPRRERLSARQADRVWDLLVQYVGASPDDRDQFMHYIGSPSPHGHEFRFIGCLGFGGKLHFTDLRGAYISCYPEDRNRIRNAIIEAVNVELAEKIPSREALIRAANDV